MVEYGFYATQNLDGTLNYENTSATTNANGMANMRLPAKPINAFVHTHAKGTNSVFSFTDLEAFFELTYSKNLTNPDNFLFGLITGDGTTYMLSIGNWTEFANWGSNTFKVDLDKYKERYGSFEEGMKRAMDNSSRELELIRYLTENRTGLKLHKGDVNNFSTWERKGYSTTSKTIIKDDCK